PPDDDRSFFHLAGYHGEPFRGPGATSSQYWGGYCQHGNVLFPTWHRAYLLQFEEALRSAPGCENVTLPFWDETSQDSLDNGIPWALTQENVELDGQTIPNPLRSFRLNADIVDRVNADSSIYTKLKGYETVRFPLAGLVGTAGYAEETAAYNKKFSYAQCVTMLNENITYALAYTVTRDGQQVFAGAVAEAYQHCLDAPTYTVFSNTSSANQWNGEHTHIEVPLEQPHNSIHVAVGDQFIPEDPTSPLASGDMGEPDTAGFDPIFFFHHCFIDRLFWLWQQRHSSTDHLDIVAGYAGTNSSGDPKQGGQPPTPGIEPNTALDLNTPLYPFRKQDGKPYTSTDCINIEKLGYTYGPGSLQDLPAPADKPASPATVISAFGINRANINGSFLISAFANTNGRPVHLGTQAVFNRWDVSTCANCQTHLEAQAFLTVPPAAPQLMALATQDMPADKSSYTVLVRTHTGIITPRQPGTGLAAETLVADIAGGEQPDFDFEIRQFR
ncbi:MAG: tyrosinase family protein, partial [Mycobacterium sp.]|nr:tyrosinase family protein [Mycobacterium sp.]